MCLVRFCGAGVCWEDGLAHICMDLVFVEEEDSQETRSKWSGHWKKKGEGWCTVVTQVGCWRTCPRNPS